MSSSSESFTNSYTNTPWLEEHWNPLISIIAIAMCGIILLTGFSVIPSGCVGIISTAGKVDDTRVLNPGVVYHAPFWQSVKKVDVRRQSVAYKNSDTDNTIYGQTDTQESVYYIGVTVSYQIKESEAAWICANMKNYQKELVSQSDITTATRTAMESLNATDAVNYQKAETAVIDALQDRLDSRYGRQVLTITNVTIASAGYGESPDASTESADRASDETGSSVEESSDEQTSGQEAEDKEQPSSENDNVLVSNFGLLIIILFAGYLIVSAIILPLL